MRLQLISESSAAELINAADAVQAGLIERAQDLIDDACLNYPDEILLVDQLKALALYSDKAHSNVVAWDAGSGQNVYLRVFWIPECVFDQVIKGLKQLNRGHKNEAFHGN